MLIPEPYSFKGDLGPPGCKEEVELRGGIAGTSR